LLLNSLLTSPEFYLIIGLGNPGREYRSNRHNVGFMVIDVLSQKIGAKTSRVQSKSLVTTINLGEKRIILAKPQIFMNLSGSAVRSLVRYYKIPLENLLIVHDDLDLPLGTIRIRPGGASAGHKGLGSIIQELQTESIPRLRVGIGRPPGRMDGADYVLEDFSGEETKSLLPVLDRAAEGILTFISSGIVTAMNQYNVVPQMD
jgi:peptidyl-tRNA hydrolase, PTH1 family